MNTPVKFVGYPDGPKVFVPELGKEVPTFSVDPGGRHPALRHHVPLKCRGPYRPEELANYDSGIAYRTDPFGYLLCGKYTLAGEKCPKRAVNRAVACVVHGGRLHPLDKLEKETQDEPANDAETEALSRYQQYLAGQLSVDDLDDEELAAGGFRAKNGSIYKPKKLPRELITAFNKAIYDRAQQELRANTVAAAQTVAEIMRNKNVEPDIRLKAANTLLDRNLGKAPQVVALTGDKGFEEVFSDLFSGTREQSRSNRVESSRVPIESGNIIDAETVDGPQPDPATSDELQPDSVTDVREQPSEHAGNDPVAERDSADTGEGVTNARLFERNDAILAQTLTVKPFEYDLSDHSQDIKNATKKRYASRALGVDLTSPDYPLERVELNGFVKWVDPKGKANIRPSKSAEKRRKTYTLSDFD